MLHIRAAFVSSALAAVLRGVFRHVFGGRHAEIFLEGGGEMVGVYHAHGVCNLRHGDVALAEELCGLLHPQVAYELAHGDSGHILHAAVELHAAQAHGLGQLLHVEVAVGEAFVHRLHYALHELRVVTIKLDGLHGAFLLLHAGELPAHAVAVGYERGGGGQQLVDVEWLVDVGVGPVAKPVDVRLVLHLGGEQYYGYVARLGVVLKAAQQREAVHLGHHHIAHHEVWQAVGDGLEGLAAIGVGIYAVVLAQLCREEVAYSLVVVDHGHPVARGAARSARG